MKPLLWKTGRITSMSKNVGVSRLALEVINKAVQDYIKPSKGRGGRELREDARKFLAGEDGHKAILTAWCGAAGISIDALQKTHKIGPYAEKGI